MKKSLVFGAIGGALGGIAMKIVVAAVDRNSFGLSRATDAKTAHDLGRRLAVTPLSERRAELLGAGMHYAFSVMAGVAYAAGQREHPALRTGKGAAFGTALWLVGDEAAVSLAGLEDPFRTPAFSHLSALGAHVVYGLIVEAVADAVNR